MTKKLFGIYLLSKKVYACKHLENKRLLKLVEFNKNFTLLYYKASSEAGWVPQKSHGKINNSARNEQSQRTRSRDRRSYLVLALSAYDRAQRRLSDPRNLSGSVIVPDQKRICTYFTGTLLDGELLPLRG